MDSIDIHSLFFPSQHIADPKWFAGRKDDIENALKSLCTTGASMVVFGDRGVGKTSFIEMIKLLAQGNSHLIYKHKLHKIYPLNKLNYKIVSFTCNEETNTTAKVLQSLITNPDGIKKLISSRKEHITNTIKDKFALDLFSLVSGGFENETTVSVSEYKEDSVFELFTNLITTISKDVLKPEEGLLIVIDEFDLVSDSSKMSSLIKTLSKDKVKFLFGGIGDTYSDLLKGHPSIMRQLMYGRIRIKLMDEKEINEVYSLVSGNTDNKIRFTAEFVKLVKEKSNGFPYYVQLFGQLSVNQYIEANGFHTPMIIHNQHLLSGIKKLSFYEEQMEQDYQNIIKENPHKELILKFLARQLTIKIKDEEVISYCFKHNIRQPLPKNTLTSLLGLRDPHFLVREKDNSDYVVFKDSLFKVFVNAREPVLIRENDNGYYIP